MIPLPGRSDPSVREDGKRQRFETGETEQRLRAARFVADHWRKAMVEWGKPGDAGRHDADSVRVPHWCDQGGSL
jgi:hypothetical protein